LKFNNHMHRKIIKHHKIYLLNNQLYHLHHNWQPVNNKCYNSKIKILMINFFNKNNQISNRYNIQTIINYQHQQDLLINNLVKSYPTIKNINSYNIKQYKIKYKKH